MIVVVGPSRSRVAGVCERLRRPGRPGVLALNELEAVRAVVETNRVSLLVADLRGASPGWIRSFADRGFDARLLSLVDDRALDALAASALVTHEVVLCDPLVPTDISARVDRAIAVSSGEWEVVAQGLEDVLGLLALSGATGRVDVRCGELSGTLHVDDGQIVRARRGARQGEAAALEIAAWVDPEIVLDACIEHAFEPEMGVGIQALLHEVRRLEDELQHIPRRVKVAKKLADLRSLEGCRGVGLARVDNGEVVHACGDSDIDLAVELARSLRDAQVSEGGLEDNGALVWRNANAMVWRAAGEFLVLSASFAVLDLPNEPCSS